VNKLPERIKLVNVNHRNSGD